VLTYKTCEHTNYTNLQTVLDCNHETGKSARPTPERPEIGSLTSLRGFLAIWVVIYHFWNDIVLLFPSSNTITPVVQMGNMAVLTFFMLSGFVLTYNYADRFKILELKNIARFYVLRLARIYPVHVATLLVLLVMVGLSSRIGVSLAEGGYSWVDFVRNLLLVHTWVPRFQMNWNYPSWSISSEWFAYLAFPFVVHALGRLLKRPNAAMAFAMASLAGAIWVVLYGQPRPFFELISVVPNFLLGMAFTFFIFAGGKNIPVIDWLSRIRWFPELLIVFVFGVCFLPWGEVAISLALSGLAMLVFTLAVMEQRSTILWRSRYAVFLGEISYSLYMTHTLVQKILYSVLPTANFVNASLAQKYFVVFAYVSLISVACAACYFAVENPARCWMKRRMA
jgi:peptidoglycan/LPS O-acetylase OafA/YrhL